MVEMIKELFVSTLAGIVRVKILILVEIKVEIFQIMKTSISNFSDNLYFNIYTDKKQITYLINNK